MSEDNRKMIGQIQHFTASSVSILNLLRTACLRTNDNELTERDIRSKTRFLNSSQAIIEQIKDNADNDFDLPKFIRKAFNTFKIKEHCDYLINKNKCLFEIRDTQN